jgi:hypothetical protein
MNNVAKIKNISKKLFQTLLIGRDKIMTMWAVTLLTVTAALIPIIIVWIAQPIIQVISRIPTLIEEFSNIDLM